MSPVPDVGYQPSELHSDQRAWTETNCYVDVWIEVLHSHGFDPRPALAFTVALDFEDDQFRFFKFPHEDLRALYGIEVHELNIWRALTVHVEEHVAAGHPVLVEVDAFFLPDTRGVSYRLTHGKTTIAVRAIDGAARTATYFHNAGSYALEGEDFDGVFGNWALPPYVEFVKLDRTVRRNPGQLAAIARALLRDHLARGPRQNPFDRYAPRLQRDFEWLKTQPLDTFHLYAFATLRQVGANFELASTFLRWLSGSGGPDLQPAAADFDAISGGAKTLQLKIARAVNGRKQLDAPAVLADLAAAWDRATRSLVAAVVE